MKLVYFAHDLTDAAVARRVAMLKAGGADVALIGFRRSPEPVPQIEGVPATDLGETIEGRLADRAALVLRRSAQVGRWAPQVADADVILARNLEMLTIADAARRKARSKGRLVYECLDIHKVMLGSGLPAKLLRAWERRLLGRSSSLIVSSPAFVREYFSAYQNADVPVVLAENKRFIAGSAAPRPQPGRSPGPPWRIGWFGLIRCRRSLALLTDLTKRHPGLLEVEIRGRPTEPLMEMLNSSLAGGVRFGGPYGQDELERMYAGVHFTWGIDYYQSGLNSTWLLPNRLYEGGYYNAPLIALDSVETGRWLADRGAGVLLSDAEVELEPFLRTLTPERYRELEARCASVPTSALAWTQADLARFVAAL